MKKAKAKNRKFRELEKIKSSKAIPFIFGLILLASLLLRIIPAFSQTFIDGVVYFKCPDAWYHLRLSENMLANFPVPMIFEPYTSYPMGTAVVAPPLWSWLTVILSYIVSLGKPTLALMAHVTAFMPPVLGTLALIPVYLTGRELYSKWAGVLAAALVAFLPTQYLQRSMLGFADHHVLEIFLVAFMMFFLIKGYKHKKLWWYGLAGICLGLYFLAWHAAPFILLVLGVWLLIQLLLDHWQGKLERTLWLGGIVTLFIGLVIFYPFRQYSANTTLAIDSFILIMMMCLVLGLLGYYVKKRKLYLKLVSSIGLVAVVVLWFGMRNFVDIVRDMGVNIFPTNLGIRTIAEAMPTPPWTLFTIYGVASILFLLGVYWTIKGRYKPLLIAVWGIIMLVAVFAQNRWSYYLVVPLALIASFTFIDLRELVVKPLAKGVSLTLLVALLLAPSAASYKLASMPSLMSPDWYQALVWLKENTPEPFSGNGETYYKLDSHEIADYAVLSWWDYGHWIPQVAHRVSVTNPFQQNVLEACGFFLDGEEVPGVKYVIISRDDVTGKFYAMLLWMGRPLRISEAEFSNLPIMKLWMENYGGWKLAYKNGSVKILEKEKA